jgi:hypothetical protein
MVFFKKCFAGIPDKKLARIASPRRSVPTLDPSSSSFTSTACTDSSLLASCDLVYMSKYNELGENKITYFYPNLSDMLAWKVRLLPRVLSVLSTNFDFESCNFKLHKSKASTMRMVTFLELGVDCVYTIEASLAGKSPLHFSVHDLIAFGEDICKGIRESLHVEVTSRSDVISERERLLDEIRKEVQIFNKVLDFSSCLPGATLLSVNGFRELTAAAAEGEGRDDVDSDIPDEDKKEKESIGGGAGKEKDKYAKEKAPKTISKKVKSKEEANSSNGVKGVSNVSSNISVAVSDNSSRHRILDDVAASKIINTKVPSLRLARENKAAVAIPVTTENSSRILQRRKSQGIKEVKCTLGVESLSARVDAGTANSSENPGGSSNKIKQKKALKGAKAVHTGARRHLVQMVFDESYGLLPKDCKLQQVNIQKRESKSVLSSYDSNHGITYDQYVDTYYSKAMSSVDSSLETEMVQDRYVSTKKGTNSNFFHVDDEDHVVLATSCRGGSAGQTVDMDTHVAYASQFSRPTLRQSSSFEF